MKERGKEKKSMHEFREREKKTCWSKEIFTPVNVEKRKKDKSKDNIEELKKKVRIYANSENSQKGKEKKCNYFAVSVRKKIQEDRYETSGWLCIYEFY